MTQGDTIYMERGVYPVYKGDLLASFTPSPPGTPAGYPEATAAYIYDAYGYRLFSYRQNRSGGAITTGSMNSNPRQAFTTITSPTPTSITKVGQFTTPNRWVNGLLTDTADGGNPPETQTARVLSHTPDTLTLDPNLPFSVAPGVGASFELVAPKAIPSATGDLAFVSIGVSMAAVALQDGDWGWFQHQGYHPLVQHLAATAVARGNTVVSGAGVVADSAGTTVGTLTVGLQAAAHPATAGVQRSPVFMSTVQWYW